jgi:hypothetical protein
LAFPLFNFVEYPQQEYNELAIRHAKNQIMTKLELNKCHHKSVNMLMYKKIISELDAIIDNIQDGHIVGNVKLT